MAKGRGQFSWIESAVKAFLALNLSDLTPRERPIVVVAYFDSLLVDLISKRFIIDPEVEKSFDPIDGPFKDTLARCAWRTYLA